jgi:transposase-like protein
MSHEDDTTVEQWRPVVGHPGYEVSDHGRVRSWRDSARHGCRRDAPHTLRLIRSRKGYLRVQLGAGRRYSVHHLVLEAFGNPRPVGMECAHSDGDPANNRLTNLRWATASENWRDRWAHGTATDGSRNGRTRITPEAAEAIHAAAANGATQRVLAELHGVSSSTIWRTLRRAQRGGR